jgi:hypothetical protein
MVLTSTGGGMWRTVAFLEPCFLPCWCIVGDSVCMVRRLAASEK